MDAIWVTSLYKVVYLGNGNTSGQAPDAISTAGTINLSENNYDLAKTGYYFEGWNETGSTTLRLPGDAFSVTQNETFTASWQRINVGIDYDLNGADTGTVPVSWDGFYGDTPSIAGNTGGMTLAGYNFTGWNTRDDGSGDHYDVNQVVTMGESNLYLYAEWSLPTPPTPNTPQQIVYVVRFDGNGSNGGSVPVIIRWIDGSPAVSIPGNSGGLTKTGYTFGGWSLSAGGGSAISSLTPTNSSTLYAIWIKNPELPGTGGTTPKPTPSTPPAATIKLEAGAKQVIPNQIVPVKDVIKLEEGAVAEKVLINGKVVSAAVTGSNTVALPQLVGPADKIQVVERIAGKDVTADIAMVTEPVDLANVNFTTDSYFLDAPARRILDKVVAVVLQHGFTTVELVGHTDAAGVNVGYDNQALSHNRAIATEKYLQAKLAGHKVTIKVDAKAHVDPIAKNSTAAGRAANRRVEIVVK